jgi:hydroxyacylglutathione hydrolase
MKRNKHGSSGLTVAEASTPCIIEHKAVGPLRCNCTLIGNPETQEAWVIDPGGDADWILSWLEQYKLKLVGVFHTHAHFDHFWASGLLRHATDAPLALHPKDAPLWDMLPVQCQLYGLEPPPGVMPKPDVWLEHTQKLALGDLKAEVIHTPGHSPGSCCFHLPQEQLLLAGDTLFRGGVGRTDLWGGDTKALETSIQKRLYQTIDEDTTVVAGHGPNTRLGDEMKNNPYVRWKS